MSHVCLNVQNHRIPSLIDVVIHQLRLAPFLGRSPRISLRWLAHSIKCSSSLWKCILKPLQVERWAGLTLLLGGQLQRQDSHHTTWPLQTPSEKIFEPQEYIQNTVHLRRYDWISRAVDCELEVITFQSQQAEDSNFPLAVSGKYIDT